MKWTNTSDAASPRVKILVHGPSGAGKTRLCGTTGDPDNTVIVSAEAGLLSLAGHSIRAVEVGNLADVAEVLAWLESPGHGVTWVCVDSISEIAEVCLAHAKAKSKDPRAAYGDMGDAMFRLIRRFRDLPMHVYMACKQGREADGDGAILRGPSLPGKQLSQGIAYLFDEVFALRVAQDDNGQTVRWLQTGGDGIFEAKDRSGKLAAAEAPDLCGVITTITTHTSTHT